MLGAAVERARHEEVVRDSEARFRELADTTPALMWMTDAEGDVTFVNEGWLRFTGRSVPEDLGDSFGSSAHPDDRDDLMTRWRDAFERRTEFRFEYRLRHRDGGHRWVLEIGTPRFAGRRVRGLRRHRHRHPRAQGDGGRAAPLRGELPRPRRQRPR